MTHGQNINAFKTKAQKSKATLNPLWPLKPCDLLTSNSFFYEAEALFYSTWKKNEEPTAQ